MPVPVVVSTSPVNNATDVPVASAVTFTFNTPLKLASVNQATVLLSRDDTAESISCRVSLSSDGLTIGLLPYKGLIEDAVYVAAVVGAADNMPGGCIKASDNTDLPTTYQIQFRIRQERYVPLTAATEPDQIERVGPIREDEEGAATALEVEETYPLGFASNVPRSLSEIRVVFSEDVLPTGSEDAMELDIHNVLGLEDYYGEQDSTGHFLWDWLKDTDTRLALFTGQPDPFGSIEFSGSQIRWVKDPQSPQFHFNTEVIVRLRADSIVSPTGHMLAEDVYLAFTTEYWPLYVGVEHVRLKLGSVVADMYDDTIRRHIHSASIDACEQALYNFDLERPYPAVRRYVRAVTILTILKELGILPNLQAGRKRLGDFEIQASPADFAKTMAAYQNAEEEAKKALAELRSYRGQGKPVWVVRGATDPTERQDFFMRTWQNVRFGEAANTELGRQAKESRSWDHPRILVIGYTDSGPAYGAAEPWWT